MGLTNYQRGICRLIATNRKKNDCAYVAGGVALNMLIDGPRISMDIDLFHDTEEALARMWDADRQLLATEGYQIEIVRERPSFVEAVVRKGGEGVLMQWTRDSAFRFFPLLWHAELGLTMHPFDLATNKVLALVGRLEVRDWIDLIQCHHKIQRLGYLIWAACGKDPGFSPGRILHEARRSSHYSAAEVAQLAFGGSTPDVKDLSRDWHGMLSEAEQIIDSLPPEQAGRCVLDSEGKLYQSDIASLGQSLQEDTVFFHEGSIRGAFPEFLE